MNTGMDLEKFRLRAFVERLAALGEVALELDRLREEGVLDRLDNGEWRLKAAG